MKCVLMFPVGGTLRVKQARPVTVRHVTYEVVTDTNLVVTHIRATVSVADPNRWPTIEPGPPIKILPRLPMEFPFIQMELRAAGGLLSFWGAENIELQKIEVEWIPENDEEKKALHLFKFTYSKSQVDPLKRPPVSFSIIARALIAAEDAYDDEVPLSFYRHGLSDLLKENYIEAIYDFYFALEHLFGGGKTQNRGVCEEFKKSERLTAAINQFLTESDPTLSMKPGLGKKVEAFKLEHKEPGAVCEFLVSLRGKLHHRNAKRRSLWHPDQQAQFEMEAGVLESIVCRVVFPMIWSYLESEKVTKTFRQIFN